MEQENLQAPHREIEAQRRRGYVPELRGGELVAAPRTSLSLLVPFSTSSPVHWIPLSVTLARGAVGVWAGPEGRAGANLRGLLIGPYR